MQVIYPPNKIPTQPDTSISIFLAGSIEMGAADPWQDFTIDLLEEHITGVDLMVFNPRRTDWNSSWEQKITNPKFTEQVEWELNALDAADEILMYFDPKTKSPITLLELGLHAETGKLTVICPPDFWRKGNVDIVCRRYGIDQLDNIESYVIRLKGHTTSW